MEFIPGQKKLEFSAIDHIYTYHGKILDNVSSIIKKYSVPFDQDGSITARKAAENGITVEEQRKEWDEIGRLSREKGTAFHHDIEQYIKTKKIPQTDNKDLIKQFAALKLKGALYSEIRLHSIKYGIAGTADLLQVFPNGIINVWDAKTTQAKKMSRYSWGRRMLYPLDHLYDSELDKFELQLSTYSFMLENAGWWIKDLIVLHIDYDKRKIKEFPLQYRRNDVILMLDHYKNNREDKH